MELTKEMVLILSRPMRNNHEFYQIEHSIQTYGFVRLANIDFNDLERIAECLGPITVGSRHPERVRLIAPQGTEAATPNTLSSRHGTGAFPFHTDCAHWEHPAQFLLLYCVNAGGGHRHTRVIDTWEWDWSPRERLAVCSEVWSRALSKPQLCTVGERRGDHISLRYDEACMTPLTQPAERSREFIQQRIDKSRMLDFEWSERDVLIIDNRRILHARGAARTADPGRVLARILIGGHE